MIQISKNMVHRTQIGDKYLTAQVLDWRLRGDKPLIKTMAGILDAYMHPYSVNPSNYTHFHVDIDVTISPSILYFALY